MPQQDKPQIAGAETRTQSEAQKMNPKVKPTVIVVVALLVGMVSGYFIAPRGVDPTLYEESLNQVSEMNVIMSEQEGTIEELSSTIDRKRDTLVSAIHEKNQEIQSLQNDYENELSLNARLQDQVSSLNDEIVSLESDKATLTVEMSGINTSYSLLRQEYEKLLSDYAMVNGPSSKMITLNDLEINLTTDRTIYNYTDAVEGTISIYYTSGEPFEGQIQFNILTNFGSSYRLSGFRHNIYGETRFYLAPPVFKWGPGEYTIGLFYVYDEGGFIIAGPNLLKDLRVNVEAK